MMAEADAHERRAIGLARGLRAAILVPVLFALALLVLTGPKMAGFAVFGTFAHLVMVTYDRSAGARFIESAMLTGCGAIMVVLGTLASGDARIAVGGAFLVGSLAEVPALARSRLAILRPTLVLAFMLAVAVPVPAQSVLPYLAGWFVAGLAAQLALLVIWFPLPASRSPTEDARARARPVTTAIAGRGWIARAAGAGAAMAFAILVTRSLRIDHAFWVVLGVLPVLNAQGASPLSVFLREQAGTVAGFVVGAALVAAVGEHQSWYWIALPVAVFAAAYAATAIGFIAGQAAFTVFAVVLFGILLPLHTDVGGLRVENIALGGAVSLATGAIRRLGI